VRLTGLMKRRKGRKKREEAAHLRLGVAWWRPEQWARLRDIAADPDALEETYEEWLAMATKELARLAEHGIVLSKVDVDVEELLAWCNEQGRAVDGAARAAFAGAKLHERESRGPAAKRRTLH
jgi:hypothetical protein